MVIRGEEILDRESRVLECAWGDCLKLWQVRGSLLWVNEQMHPRKLSTTQRQVGSDVISER